MVEFCLDERGNLRSNNRDSITFLLSANIRMITNNRHTFFAISFYELTTILYHTLYVVFSHLSIDQTR